MPEASARARSDEEATKADASQHRRRMSLRCPVRPWREREGEAACKGRCSAVGRHLALCQQCRRWLNQQVKSVSAAQCNRALSLWRVLRLAALTMVAMAANVAGRGFVARKERPENCARIAAAHAGDGRDHGENGKQHMCQTSHAGIVDRYQGAESRPKLPSAPVDGMLRHSSRHRCTVNPQLRPRACGLAAKTTGEPTIDAVAPERRKPGARDRLKRMGSVVDRTGLEPVTSTVSR